jgi:hypothetical protein
MDLEKERMYYAGSELPLDGKGFGGLYQDGFYINYLHGLDFLCRKHINKETKVLELGSFNGVSSELFSKYSNHVTSVDIELYPEMEKVIKRCGINFVQNNSISYLNSIVVGMYDLIYLDTTHGYYDTLNELKNIYYKLNTNQVLCGHDYNSQGVSSAINDLFQYPDIEIYLDGSWSIIKNNRLILKK